MNEVNKSKGNLFMTLKKHIIAAGIFLLSASAAQAQEFVATFGEWSVFTLNRGGNTICYIASAPVKHSGNFSKRSDPYLLVTHRSAAVDEVSTSAGYPFKPNSTVTVNVDGKKWQFFTEDELAWAKNTDTDRAAVAAMKKGNRMTVKGTSTRGTYSLDTYSLKGITAAYNKMKSLCN